MTEPSASSGANPDQLTGWKEVANYLGKSVRTVQRWERVSGLPVHRVQPLGEVVYAFRSEIDSWRSSPAGANALTPSHPACAPSAAADEAIVDAADTAAPPPQPAVERRRSAVLAVIVVALLVSVAGASMALFYTSGSDLSLSVVPDEPQVQGQHFRVTAKAAGSLGPVARWTRLPNGREEMFGPPLVAGPTGAVIWSFSTDCRTETGTHTLWVRDERSGRLSESASLVVLPNADCTGPLPDLAANITSLDRGDVGPGGRITVHFSVWNMGTAAAVETLTRIRLSTHSSRTVVTDVSLGDVVTPPLDVRSSVKQSATLTIPSETSPGVYYLWIVADNGSATIEPNSFNNFARSHAFLITAR